jgi:hypothetical protein
VAEATAEQASGQRGVDEPRRERVDPDRSESRAAFAAMAGIAAAEMAARLEPARAWRASVPVMNVSDPPGRMRVAHSRAIRSDPSRCSSSTFRAWSKSISVISE